MDSRVTGAAPAAESQVEADTLCHRKQKQVEDDLSEADKNVLCRVHSLAGGDLEYEVREEEEAQEKRHVLEGAVYRLIWVSEFNKCNSESSRLETGDCVADPSARTPRAINGTHHSAVKPGGHVVAYGQKPAIEPGLGPVALHAHASGFSECEQGNLLRAGKAQRGADSELLAGCASPRPYAKEFQFELPRSIRTDGEILGRLSGERGIVLPPMVIDPSESAPRASVTPITNSAWGQSSTAPCGAAQARHSDQIRLQS